MKENRQTNSLISNSRWLAYATAGAASALGSAASAEGEIHYSGILNAEFRQTNGTANAMSFPLQDGAKLVFLNGYGENYNGEPYYGAWFGIFAAVSNQFRGKHGIYVSRLPHGELVSQGHFTSDAPERVLGGLGSSYGAGYFGSRMGKNTGFIGFRFNTGAGTQYGWARLQVRDTHLGAASGFILIDYAWADPGESIKTGHKLRSAKTAMGFIGVTRSRRRGPHGVAEFSRAGPKTVTLSY